MSLLIPDEVIRTSRMSEREMQTEIALMLFEKEKLTLAQASRLAGMSRLEFQHLLASRKIPVHYGESELSADLDALRDTRH